MPKVDRTQTSVEADGPKPDRLELWVIGPDVHHRLVLEPGTVTLGRGEQCTIHLDHTSVSRVHLTVFVGRDVQVEDVNSRNGTLLNGQKLKHTLRYPLSVRDVVEIGPFRLFLQPAAAVATSGNDDEAPLIKSAAMQRVFALVEQVAQGSISVLILGETGVGKDVVARSIHKSSPRASGPFMRLNCAAVTESLVESELFGHTRGAFTGAVSAREGLIEASNGGTLFLDEVGELSSGLQAKLLHVLETREVTRVGSTEPIRVDVRFVAATHRQLDAASASFRRDLYYRLAGAVIEVPPLRERRDDVVPLAERFMRAVAGGLGRPARALSPRSRAALEAHRWPGNVRELRNVIERAVLTNSDVVIGPAAAVAPVSASSTDASASGFQLSAEELAERARIIDALEACAGNQTRAAKMLGWARSTFAAKLVALRIPRPRA